MHIFYALNTVDSLRLWFCCTLELAIGVYGQVGTITLPTSLYMAESTDDNAAQVLIKVMVPLLLELCV